MAWQELGMSYCAISSRNTYRGLVRVDAKRSDGLPWLRGESQGADCPQISVSPSLHFPGGPTGARWGALCPCDGVSEPLFHLDFPKEPIKKCFSYEIS